MSNTEVVGEVILPFVVEILWISVAGAVVDLFLMVSMELGDMVLTEIVPDIKSPGTNK